MPLLDLRPQAVRRSPQDLLAHMRSFRLDLKFSVGIWYFTPAASRFHDKYGPDLTIEQRLDIAAGLTKHGLSGGGIEAHYPNEINEGNADLWRTFSRQTGIRLITIIPLLFWDKRFEFGSLSNPDPTTRAFAIERTKACLALNRQFDTDFAIVWPGIDGFEAGNSFGMDFPAARARFAEGLAEAMDWDQGAGVRIAFEPKPYEPRGRILFGTTTEGLLLGRNVEAMLRHPTNTALLKQRHHLLCMNPEVGHVLMGFEDLAYAYSWPLEEARLAHTHWNSQPLGNYDQDLGVGAVSPELTLALLYTLKMHAYRGYFGIDINPERVPVDVALRNSFDALRRANERVEKMDHESILAAHARPEANRGVLERCLH